MSVAASKNAPRALGRSGAARIEDASDLVFRVLFSVIFITAGVGHLVRPEEFVERLVAAPLGYLATSIGPAEPLVVLSGLALLAGGLGLLIGYRTRSAALLLIAVLVPITVTIDLGHTNALGPLFKNVGMLGGLVHFAARGPGAFAVEKTARPDRGVR
jgi:putative oxidoreductase